MFSNNNAYGLTNSISMNSDLSCNYNVHMAIDYISNLGVSLYYA